MIGGLGTPELLIILFIILLLFGGRKLPELAQSLGRAVSEYNKASSGNVEADKASKVEIDENMRRAILDSAKRLGIETEGRDIREIARDVAKATG